MGKTSKINKNHYLIILCGGTGPRLWPLSRADKPKQFLKLLSSDSLLNQTIKRSLKITNKEKIFVVSNVRYSQQIKKETRGLIPSTNIIEEPEKKNTAMAIVYASSVIYKMDQDAVITSLPSDHFIKNEERFKNDILLSAIESSENAVISTIGISPEYPNQSYGYLIPETKNFSKLKKIKKFVEKPNEKQAKVLIEQGALWNSGIYTFSIKTLLSELAKHGPNYHKLFEKLINERNTYKLVEKVFKLSDNLSIDNLISEKSSKLVCLPASFIWSDIGEWRTIYQKSTKDKSSNSILNPDTNTLQFNSTKCLVSGDSKKLIGLVGVSNLAIIDTKDALLICNMDHAYNVRDLVSQIVSSEKTKNYFLPKNAK